MKLRARKDASHNAIVEVLEAHGIAVMETHQFGQGFPDVLCYGLNRSTGIVGYLPIEFKTPSPYQRKNKTYRGKPTKQGPDLTEAQQRLLRKMQFPCVETAEAALALFGIVS